MESYPLNNILNRCNVKLTVNLNQKKMFEMVRSLNKLKPTKTIV